MTGLHPFGCEVGSYSVHSSRFQSPPLQTQHAVFPYYAYLIPSQGFNALSATQRVAVGLTSEIFRQVGTGVGALAEATAKTVSQTAQAAAKGIGAVTDSAVEVATELRDKITGVFQRKPPDVDAESEPQGGESP